jgi:hypothetical protein
MLTGSEIKLLRRSKAEIAGRVVDLVKNQRLGAECSDG